MCFLTTWNTDVGVRKKTNQDGLLIKTAQSKVGSIGMFAVCDGMGGLSLGELASSSLIIRISNWFDKKLPQIVSYEYIDNEIKSSFKQEVMVANTGLELYGKKNGLKIGTTLSSLLVVDDKYYIFHVGDSRVYKIDTAIKQLTEDQTFINREIKLGRITKSEAENHPKKNVLIECVGVTPNINIFIYQGNIEKDEVFVIASDGFYSKIKEEELLKEFNPSILLDEIAMKNKVDRLTQVVKDRNEKDNISVILLKIT